jgi:hypothetical protein
MVGMPTPNVFAALHLWGVVAYLNGLHVEKSPKTCAARGPPAGFFHSIHDYYAGGYDHQQ